MNFEEAILTALELEERAKQIYLEKADELKSAIATNIFTMLAKEEQGHIDYLNKQLAYWKETGEVNDEKLESAFPQKAFLEEKLEGLVKKTDPADADNEVAIFKMALEIEIKISKLYRELVATLPENTRFLFEGFLEIEECHEAIIQAEISSAVGSGVWFDIMEFDQEAG